MNSTWFTEFKLYIGLPASVTPAKEIALASLTSLVATLCVLYFSHFILDYINITQNVTFNVYVVMSIAATCVLIFAVPHGALSQPWSVIAGHLSSASVGVLCWQYLGSNLLIAAAFSVSLSILVMSVLRCIHPPGGATALGAVLGGDAIHNLGLTYLLFPTLLNCSIILIAAIAFNYPFRWRRYPAHCYFKTHANSYISPGDRENEITIEDFMKSISEHDSFIDMTEEGWTEIFENAKRHAELDIEHPNKLERGLAYSNGKLGKKWEIRKVVTIDSNNNVSFKILAGTNYGLSGRSSTQDFLDWAKFSVEKNTNNVWCRKSGTK